MSGLPANILEQAVRPIGAVSGDTGAPCKAFQSQAKRPKGQRTLHDHKQLVPELSGDQLKILTWQDAFLKLVDEVETSGVEALSGNTINYEPLQQKLPTAVEAGLVTQAVKG